MSSDAEAAAILRPHFDAMRDLFAGSALPDGTSLVRLADVSFAVDRRAGDSPRHFAGTRVDGRKMIFAPGIVDLPVDTMVAILGHEFGHAADFRYPGHWTWPVSRAGKSAWVGANGRAAAYRFMFGKQGARAGNAKQEREVADLWDVAWKNRTPDQIEWAADGIVFAVTGKRTLYAGPCLLQTYGGGVARPEGLR